MSYFWLKALHLIFVVSWFAGIFYLPRIFVNIQLTEHLEVKQHLLVMARKLYRFITPFMALTIAFGVSLAYINWELYQTQVWFHIKMTIMLLLIGYHFLCGYFYRQLLENKCQRSHLFFRIYNEIPVFALFAMIILAVLKPQF